MKRPSEVKEFYDDFAGRVLMRDFYYVNLRHEEIKRLCSRFIPKRAAVLEIGCGVGIISKFLHKRTSRLMAIDISDENIAIARRYAGGPTCEFRVMDAVGQASELEGCGQFDVVLMADVLEHIPKEKYAELLPAIEKVLTERGRVILTFPSPENQEYMLQNKPQERQVIDESVHLEDILGVTNLKLLYFSYRNVFGTNDYVHMVLTTDRSFSAEGPRENVFGWLRHRIRKYRWRLSNLVFLRRIARRERGD